MTAFVCMNIGGNCDLAIRGIAEMWKQLLSHNNAELGIDEEFTRPGIMSLLDHFKRSVEEIPDQDYYRFNWQASTPYNNNDISLILKKRKSCCDSYEGGEGNIIVMFFLKRIYSNCGIV